MGIRLILPAAAKLHAKTRSGPEKSNQHPTKIPPPSASNPVRNQLHAALQGAAVCTRPPLTALDKIVCVSLYISVAENILTIVLILSTFRFVCVCLRLPRGSPWLFHRGEFAANQTLWALRPALCAKIKGRLSRLKI